jgi:DNA-binding CsgD family transcriptional regulator
MPAKTLTQTLEELHTFASKRLRRSARVPDAAPLIARLLGPCKTLAMEQRVSGVAFQFRGVTDSAAPFVITCLVHSPSGRAILTTAEQAVADLLCEGRTLAQVASVRGVSLNTVKSQVRQIFRKLNVDSRVALVRQLSP